MGNTSSSPNGVNQTPDNNIKSLSTQIDDIAVHYILKQNTIDLLRLTDKEYYDNLIILTSKILEHRLNDVEIGMIHNRVNGNTNVGNSETIGEAVFSLVPESERIKNKMIMNISKFYIKIIMIYSAIVSTIDPQYTYEDETGQKQVFYLKDIDAYKKIPRGITPTISQISNPMNLCRKRLNILKNKLDSSDPDEVTLNPGEKLCDPDMNLYNLTDEVGIKELDLLYYDIFDYEKKTWSKRSKEMDTNYKRDLTLFYQIFTGKSRRPVEVKSFKDIELLDFRTIDYCRQGDLFMKDMRVSKTNQDIIEYLDHIKKIEESTLIYRQKLSDILKQIFIMKTVTKPAVDGIQAELMSNVMLGGFFWKKKTEHEPIPEPVIQNIEYTINTELTLNDINKLEEVTRKTILELYLTCQKNFIKALLVFEKIYEDQTKNINEQRLKNAYKNIPYIMSSAPFPNSSVPIEETPPIKTDLNLDTFSNLSRPTTTPLYKTPFNQQVPIQPSKNQLFKTPMEEPPSQVYNPLREQIITDTIPREEAVSNPQMIIYNNPPSLNTTSPTIPPMTIPPSVAQPDVSTQPVPPELSLNPETPLQPQELPQSQELPQPQELTHPQELTQPQESLMQPVSQSPELQPPLIQPQETPQPQELTQEPIPPLQPFLNQQTPLTPPQETPLQSSQPPVSQQASRPPSQQPIQESEPTSLNQQKPEYKPTSLIDMILNNSKTRVQPTQIPVQPQVQQPVQPQIQPSSITPPKL